MPVQLSADAVGLLDDVTLLNRAIYGGPDGLRSKFLDDYDSSRDPDKVGNREALFVYDRYDAYLRDYGFTTLTSDDLGFAANEISASETSDGLDHNYTYAGGLFRNNYVSEGGNETAFTGAGAVAMTTLKENDTGNTLYLTFRGTDADGPLADGEAGTAAGQKRYYGQLRELIDQIYDYVSNADNDVTEVVLSGHSLGGAIADIFALYDGARFADIDGVKLSVVALASAGIAPDLLTQMAGYDDDMVEVGNGGAISLKTPDWYFQYDQAEDIVRNPDQYDSARHFSEDPTQALVTGVSVATLRDHLHFDDNRLTFETPLIDQYAISKNLETTFLVNHYADFYELIGTEFSKAWSLVGEQPFGRFVALFGESDAVKGTPGHNNVNGWGVSSDSKVDYTASGLDQFVLGFSGIDKISTGSGDDFISGGAGDDRIFGGDGADHLLGDIKGKSGNDRLAGGSGDDTLDADRGNDRLRGDEGADLFRIGRNNDHDVITDFSLTDGDMIDLTALKGIDGWLDLDGKIEFQRNKLIIEFSDADMLVIKGAEISDISELAFLF
jgi:Ca2+-binding RTX toxin-like protein